MPGDCEGVRRRENTTQISPLLRFPGGLCKANRAGRLKSPARPARPTLVSRCETRGRHSISMMPGCAGADVARTTSAADLAGLLLVVADLRTVPLRWTDRLKVDDNRKAGDLRSGRVRGRETSTQHRTTTRQVRGRETSAQRPTYAQRVNYCCSFVNWRMPDFARSSMAFRAS